MIRRRTGQPRQPKQTGHVVLDTLGELVPRAPGGAPPPPPLPPASPASLVATLLAGRACPTWYYYVPALRDWQRSAAANGCAAIPAKSAELLRFLATRTEAYAGSAQTKMRICAINAACWRESPPLRGTPPTGHFGVAPAG